ncbi:hypothetical protein NW762_008940 [Fusarium torreyae]|uniref:Uncharacterized protein n=1 Tax=Fusarium torreyae TaxID=1237075 RepID=A0A9W8VBT3_9HYPO|nr:hypothetical protein NW762_008940 [Fusarium torreyae]
MFGKIALEEASEMPDKYEKTQHEADLYIHPEYRTRYLGRISDITDEQPENLPSSVSCFCNYAKLCVFICTDILERLYSDIEEHSDNSSVALYSRYLGEVPELCSRIDSFLEDLTSHLKRSESCSDSPGPSSLFRAQAQFLEERTLYVRLLLLRPGLVNSIKFHGQMNSDNLVSPASLLRGNATKDINLLCVSIAYAVIDLLHTNMKTSAFTTAWHSVRMTFGSAIVVVAASLLSDLHVDLDQMPAKSSWNKVLEILDYYRLQDPSAQQAVNTLWNYRTKFSTLKSKDNLGGFLSSDGGSLGMSLDLPALDENLLDELSASLVNDSFALDGFY